ncbi:MAG: exonuclease domain-containing protein, partial [Bacteroidales bacterium]|nr:exonuclease domain-containing protein [Bacteroidales bacterium]
MRQQSFFFYDLETSGLNPRADRIMQFAGQRTDMELNPIGEPVNILVKITEDALPSPSAILVTKITPQVTLMDGMSEAEFCKYVTEEIFVPNTVAVGYNTVRFDD